MRDTTTPHENALHKELIECLCFCVCVCDFVFIGLRDALANYMELYTNCLFTLIKYCMIVDANPNIKIEL